MARRSTHTKEELRTLIVDAATRLVRTNGLSGWSARQLAAAINYSPGTLYNVFDNLDEILFEIEANVLNDLAEAIAMRPLTGEPRADLDSMVALYTSAVYREPRLWQLVFRDDLSSDVERHPSHREQCEALRKALRAALGAVMEAATPEDVDSATDTLWCSLFAMMALSTSDKFVELDAPRLNALARRLVSGQINA
ncbi:MAG: TetR/AcrR family transcriptional regulator [Pseudomonadota bacterium]